MLHFQLPEASIAPSFCRPVKATISGWSGFRSILCEQSLDTKSLSGPSSSSCNAESPDSRYEHSSTSSKSIPKAPLWTRRKDSGQAMNDDHGSHGSATTSARYNGYYHSSPDEGVHGYNTLAYLQSQVKQVSKPVSRTGSRAPSPVHFEDPTAQDQSKNGRYSTHHAVASYLRLPAEISNGRQNSLAEFTAEITCLFWFESATTLASIEHAPHCPTPATRLAQDAVPTTGFLKWVTTILTTTQVSTSVVLLALLFIHRLKKQNPQVNGKSGSEYRLLTVALMLGNKFLDDNTYTNKTWAEVSGIDVKEIHVMEVEFLSHMKYNLFTSKEQWKDWYIQLSKFWTFHDLASRRFREAGNQFTNQRPPTLQIPFSLPSPPASSTESPQYASAGSPAGTLPSHISALPPQMAPASRSPAFSIPDYDSSASSSRKRSWDEVALEPAPKRQHVVAPLRQRTPRTTGSQGSIRGDTLPSLPSLPFPTLPPPVPQQRGYSVQEPYTPQSMTQSQLQLSSGHNTPSSLLPTANWLQGLPQSAPSSQRPSNAMAYALGSRNNSAFPSRHQTPTSTFQATNPFEGQTQYSPSHYLSKRTSPYRPVRHMSQLTQAPPSRHMYEYPAQVSNEQMQWQPLKKNVEDNERRSGTVPYYQDAYTWGNMPVYEDYSRQSSAYRGS